jgi:hypothetical protein
MNIEITHTFRYIARFVLTILTVATIAALSA